MAFLDDFKDHIGESRINRLKDLKDHDGAQRLFDKVATHLLAQNEKSIAYGTCLYRTDNGLMCAAGCLISDDDYDPSMEDNLIDHVFRNWPDVQRGICMDYEISVEKAQTLIGELQEIHDDQKVADWKKALNAIAGMCGFSRKAIK